MSLENHGSAHILYETVIRTSNSFLHNCKTFPMDMLKGEDPSYAQLAKMMRRVATIITLLADSFDPMMGQKAAEYCELMTKMGIAIDNSDQVDLDRLVVELQRKPGV